jgi:enterochelin esterase-like enzyme
VLEPQSTLLFVVLILMFGGLTWWLVIARRVPYRIIAACLSFTVAVAFGVLAVNRYFGYYGTWGAAIADLSNQNPNSGPQVSEGSLLVGDRSPVFDQHAVYLKLALLQGYTLHLDVTGRLSHITRSVYVYLPPEYFEAKYKSYKFPVIELIHGEPGQPQDWINVVGVQVTLNNLIRQGQATPAVLVMPDANGGDRISLQCLNQVSGPQDLTYLAEDVPDVISHLLRVQQPGPGWGVAGFSEGGFCAANMALRFRYRYGFAASMSGYFSPFLNKLTNSAKLVSPFGGSRQLRMQNTPIDEVRALAPGARLPQFWLGAGEGDNSDMANAEYFAQELQLHEAQVPLDLTPGGGHTMGTWHSEVPPMIAWMTKGLAGAVANDARIALDKKIATDRTHHHHGKRHPAKHHPGIASPGTGSPSTGSPSTGSGNPARAPATR